MIFTFLCEKFFSGFWECCVQMGKEVLICGHMRIPTANNRESPRIAFFPFRLLDLRSRHYATPDRLRVAVTAERKMLENPRCGFSPDKRYLFICIIEKVFS